MKPDPRTWEEFFADNARMIAAWPAWKRELFERSAIKQPHPKNERNKTMTKKTMAAPIITEGCRVRITKIGPHDAWLDEREALVGKEGIVTRVGECWPNKTSSMDIRLDVPVPFETPQGDVFSFFQVQVALV